jgi:hypothetical protein
MTHATVDVSVAELDVMVKLVDDVRADTRSQPGVPPSTCDVRRTREFAVTEASETTADPADSVAVPCLILVSAVEPEPKFSCPVERVIRNGMDSVEPASLPATI